MDRKEIVKAAIEICGNEHVLANKLGVTPPAVYHWRKRKNPSGEHLIAMLNMLKEHGKTIALTLGVGVLILTGAPQGANAAKPMIAVQKHCVLCQIARRRFNATMRAIFTHAIKWLLPFPA